MSLILSARYVHRPRWAYRCGDCGRLLGPHIRLYGRARACDPPSTLRLCVACCDGSGPKIRAALAEAAAHADEVAAEAERLAAWNGAHSRDQP